VKLISLGLVVVPGDLAGADVFGAGRITTVRVQGRNPRLCAAFYYFRQVRCEP